MTRTTSAGLDAGRLVCSGCFHHPGLAIGHMAALRSAAGRFRFATKASLTLERAGEIMEECRDIGIVAAARCGTPSSPAGRCQARGYEIRLGAWRD